MLDENQVATQEGHSEEGQTSESKTETSAKAPKKVTLTEKELSDRLAKAGIDRVNEITRQFNTQIADLTKRLEEREAAEELAKIDQNNPTELTVHQQKQRIKALEKERDAAIAEANQHKEHSTKWIEHEQRQQSLLEMKEIAGEYENIDVEDLVGKTRDDAIAFCKKYGKPKEGEPEGQHVPDSNVTSGGKQDFSHLTPRQKIEKGLRDRTKAKK